MRTATSLLVVLATLVGCGGGASGALDAAGADGSIGDVADPCAADDVIATLGCNGGFVCGDPAPGAAAGPCASDTIARGTCAEGSVCLAGRCMPTCTPGPRWVSTGGCPTGFRCESLAGGLCFRDCDPAHACPSGMTCASGMCMPPL